MVEKQSALSLDYQLAARCFLAGYECGISGQHTDVLTYTFIGFLYSRYDFDDVLAMSRIAADAMLEAIMERSRS